eukprot:TRINITY_DN104032_c0_g1_i1.p1 TRINITY_DN104032_c0_g1~~TRINITY_DN104032_c0_g1_i1.p1  ORF type:complete len:275 (-),score=119.17 TRINITY_DN104032_c0_g1_i1:39-818(-)
MFRQRMRHISAFLEYKKIPVELRQRVFDYYEYCFSHRQLYPFSEDAVVSDLSPFLRNDILYAMHSQTIRKVPFLKDKSEPFIRMLVSLLKSVVMSAGDVFIREGERGSRMFFIIKGDVQVYRDHNGETIRVLHQGDIVGELSLLFASTRTASVRALTHCDLYSLSKRDLESVLLQYPQVALEVRQYAKEYKFKNRRQNLQVESQWHALEHSVDRLISNSTMAMVTPHAHHKTATWASEVDLKRDSSHSSHTLELPGQPQ